MRTSIRRSSVHLAAVAVCLGPGHLGDQLLGGSEVRCVSFQDSRLLMGLEAGAALESLSSATELSVLAPWVEPGFALEGQAVFWLLALGAGAGVESLGPPQLTKSNVGVVEAETGIAFLTYISPFILRKD